LELNYLKNNIMEDPKFGHNKEQSFIEFSTTEGKFRLGKEDGKIFLEINESKTYLTDDDGTINAAASELGADPTPVVRTVGPIVATAKPNVNIDALDAAIGANVNAYTRSVGQIATNLAVNQNINNLDTAIGADSHLTPLTRTTGQLALGTTLYQMLELIDTLIGSDAQMPVSSLNVSRALTIYQNLRALDTYKTVRTVKYKVGNFGVASSDANFAANADANEQSMDLGELLPAKCRLVDVMVYTDAAFTNLGALTTDVGLTTGAGDLIGAANNTAIDSVMATANAGAFIATPSKDTQHVWLNVKPTNNWDSADPVGRMSVYVTFINLTNV
jgi:hypothetical protein